jgi:hypothetical protein
LGYHLQYHFIAFFGGLFIAGLIIGLRSPGVAVKESGAAGFFAVVLNMDIVCVALGVLDFHIIFFGIILGILFTLFGGWVGEKMQTAQAAENIPQSRIES